MKRVHVKELKSFKEQVDAKYDVLGGDVVHFNKKKLEKIDYGFIGHMLSKADTVDGVVKLLQGVEKKGNKNYLDQLMKVFNVKDLRGLAGEMMEYAQNHEKDIAPFLKPDDSQKLIKDLTKGTKRYPKAKRKLSEKDIERLDELFGQMNRMSRSDSKWDGMEAETDKLLGYK